MGCAPSTGSKCNRGIVLRSKKPDPEPIEFFQFKVPHYWMVDPIEKTMEMYELGKKEYQLIIFKCQCRDSHAARKLSGDKG